MKQTAAQLAVYALEQLGITHTFGIPGVHNTELYDALSQSKKINPMLVTHELGGSFLAEGMSRASQNANIGTLMVVPAAGLTHAASGIGEAYLDGVPMLILTGGIRTDTPYQYKLHEVDQIEVAKGFTKAAFRINSHQDVVSTIFDAYTIATEGCPGPVLVEIPLNLQLFPQEVGKLPTWQKRQHWSDTPARKAKVNETALHQCIETLLNASQVAMFVGWGARHVKKELTQIAEILGAPVATTLQGLSSFPHDHPLHVGFGLSPSAVPSAQNAYAKADCLLAIGTRFSEIPTGSFGLSVPDKLVHLDIDPNVIGANYPATASLVADSVASVPALLKALRMRLGDNNTTASNLTASIAKDKESYKKAWLAHNTDGKVNAARFFNALRNAMPVNAITVLDDGNHTFMTAELFSLYEESLLLTPTDFNAMGYAVPATIGAKLANPDKEVFSIVGDGCFTMTCMEVLTARKHGLGVIYFIFNDGELSQIAQAQQIPYQEKACTILPGANFEGVALATGAHYLTIQKDTDIDRMIAQARELAAKNVPVIVDINIDYSKKTAFTRGTSLTTFKSFELKDKMRFASRVVKRRLF